MVLEGKHIFVIEDNPGNVIIFSMYLEQSGATVTADRGAGDIVELLLSRLPIDLILLDMMLPRNTSGFNVFDKIHQTPELMYIPIVAVSAADPETIIPIAQRKGFAGFISKPLNPRIASYIAEVIEGKEVWIGSSNSLST